jgi:hypothetical protein
VPSYYEIGRLSKDQDRIFESLKNRYNQIKSEGLSKNNEEEDSEKFLERISILESYFEKIEKAKTERKESEI